MATVKSLGWNRAAQVALGVALSLLGLAASAGPAGMAGRGCQLSWRRAGGGRTGSPAFVAASTPKMARARGSMARACANRRGCRTACVSLNKPPSRTPLLRMAAAAAGGSQEEKEWEVVEGFKETLVVLPIGDEIKGKDIDCEITKKFLLLGVNGRRLVEGEMWGVVNVDESYWEIDAYGSFDRAVIVRLIKQVPAEWQFLLKSDYRPQEMAASRKTISRKEASKEEVERALQLLVALMRPPVDVGNSSQTGQETQQKKQGSSEKEWYKAVNEVLDDEWRDTGKDMKEAMQKGASPDQIQELLSITQDALRSAEGPKDAVQAPVAALMFVRHGKTLPAEDDSVEADAARQLTEDGKAGAGNARRWFNTVSRKDDAPHGLTFSSSAGRCLETAFLMGAPEAVVLEAIYDGVNKEEALAAFKHLGYSPLSKYVSEGYGNVLRTYAELALVELADGIEQEVEARRASGGSGYLGTISVFGHAVYSSAMAMLVAQALKLSKEDLAVIANCVQGEAEGILVCHSGTGHCNADATKLDQDVDMRTARSLSAVYTTLKATGLM